MKKFSKKLSLMFALVTLLVLFSAISAQARPVTPSLLTTKKATLTLYNKKDVFLGTETLKMNEQTLGYVTAKVTNLKSSNKSVLTVGKSESAYSRGTWTFITATAKKTGTATVSFKANNKTYKVKVTVEKYTNPISYIKIGSTVITASEFESTSNYTLKYSKYAGKKAKVTVKLASGWDFYNYVTHDGEQEAFAVYPKAKSFEVGYANGKSVKISGTKGYTFNITAVQKSTGRTEDISVILK